MMRIFSTLLKLSSIEKFRDFITDARKNQGIKLKNDDVALVVLRVLTENQRSQKIVVRPVEDGFRDSESRSVRRSHISADKTFLSKPSQRSTAAPFSLLSSGEQPFSVFSNNTSKEKASKVASHSQRLKAEAKITSLKRQRRMLLVALGIAALFFMISDSFQDRSKARIQENILSDNRADGAATDLAIEGKQLLSSGTRVYLDGNFTNPILATSDYNPVEVEATEQGSERYKFKVTLYAYQPDTRNKQIPTYEAGTPLYTKRDREEAFLFGYLLQEINKPKRGFFERGSWTTVELEGYVLR